MLRVVFTVVLAVAVVGVALPAVEWASVERSDASTRAAVEEFVGEAEALARDSEALPATAAGARRVVTLSFPESGFASAGLVALHVEQPSSSAVTEAEQPVATRLSWRVADGTTHVRQIRGVAIRVADRRAGNGGASRQSLLLESGGRHRLTLALVRRDGRRIVEVSVGLPETTPAAEGSSTNG